MDVLDIKAYRISYLPGYKGKIVSELDQRKIPFVPAKGNKDSVLVDLSPERADELRGLEGVMSVLKMPV
jgi:hypothetical protein